MAAGIIYHDAGLSDRWTFGGGIFSGFVALYANETQHLSRRLDVIFQLARVALSLSGFASHLKRQLSNFIYQLCNYRL